MPVTLIFATCNEQKFSESSEILTGHGINLRQLKVEILEIQTEDVSALVERKTKDAYKSVGRALFVEHTSLHIDYINQFPAGHTRVFLSYFGEDKICELFGVDGRKNATAITTIGYCDGRTVREFQGKIRGTIAPTPGGNGTPWGAFGFNRIFIPEGSTKTLSEMGMTAKNAISMRKLAIDGLVNFVTTVAP